MGPLSFNLYFYVGNLTQNANNSKRFNANNEFNVRNIKN